MFICKSKNSKIKKKELPRIINMRNFFYMKITIMNVFPVLKFSNIPLAIHSTYQKIVKILQKK